MAELTFEKNLTFGKVSAEPNARDVTFHNAAIIDLEENKKVNDIGDLPTYNIQNQQSRISQGTLVLKDHNSVADNKIVEQLKRNKTGIVEHMVNLFDQMFPTIVGKKLCELLDEPISYDEIYFDLKQNITETQSLQLIKKHPSVKTIVLNTFLDALSNDVNTESNFLAIQVSPSLKQTYASQGISDLNVKVLRKVVDFNKYKQQQQLQQQSGITAAPQTHNSSTIMEEVIQSFCVALLNDESVRYWVVEQDVDDDTKRSSSSKPKGWSATNLKDKNLKDFLKWIWNEKIFNIGSGTVKPRIDFSAMPMPILNLFRFCSNIFYNAILVPFLNSMHSMVQITQQALAQSVMEENENIISFMVLRELIGHFNKLASFAAAMMQSVTLQSVPTPQARDLSFESLWNGIFACLRLVTNCLVLVESPLKKTFLKKWTETISAIFRDPYPDPDVQKHQGGMFESPWFHQLMMKKNFNIASTTEILKEWKRAMKPAAPVDEATFAKWNTTSVSSSTGQVSTENDLKQLYVQMERTRTTNMNRITRERRKHVRDLHMLYLGQDKFDRPLMTVDFFYNNHSSNIRSKELVLNKNSPLFRNKNAVAINLPNGHHGGYLFSLTLKEFLNAVIFGKLQTPSLSAQKPAINVPQAQKNASNFIPNQGLLDLIPEEKPSLILERAWTLYQPEQMAWALLDETLSRAGMANQQSSFNKLTPYLAEFQTISEYLRTTLRLQIANTGKSSSDIGYKFFNGDKTGINVQYSGTGTSNTKFIKVRDSALLDLKLVFLSTVFLSDEPVNIFDSRASQSDASLLRGSRAAPSTDIRYVYEKAFAPENIWKSLFNSDSPFKCCLLNLPMEPTQTQTGTGTEITEFRFSDAQSSSLSSQGQSTLLSEYLAHIDSNKKNINTTSSVHQTTKVEFTPAFCYSSSEKEMELPLVVDFGRAVATNNTSLSLHESRFPSVCNVLSIQNPVNTTRANRAVLASDRLVNHISIALNAQKFVYDDK